MGKVGPRLASRKKAKRWAKGQSSSSNPETTKYREQATSMFFKDLPSGVSGITQEDLQKHDAIQGIQPQIAKLDIHEDTAESTVDGTVNTFDTFASNYSNCSNISFSSFLGHFQSSSILHKEMLAVLSAITEVIKQNDGNETSTEYFAALMKTLEAVEDDTSVAATVSLLGMILKTVPKSVLNLQFGNTSQALLQILAKYAATENALILRHCLGCLSVLLRAQEAAIWTNSSTMQVLDAVLSFSTHTKPKVRKSAQHGLCAVLKASDVMKGEKPLTHHPAAARIATHCIAQLNTVCEPGGVTAVLQTLVLLKDVMHQLPKSHVKTICENLLRIMTLKNVLITSCCLQTLHGLFVSRPSETTLPPQRNAQIITALYDYQPPVSDTQPTLAWLAVMQEAHCNLAHSSLSLCAAVVPHFLSNCIELWRSDKTEVISGTSHTIKTVLQECVTPLCEDDQRIQEYESTLRQIVSMIHKALSYQYLEAWHHVLHLIALLFQITGRSKLQGLLDIVQSLGELRDSYNFAHNSDVEYAVGAAIRAMGPRVVLEVLPLQVDGDAVNLKRGWLIPLLKDCITCGTISFFTDVLLPIIQACERKAKEEPINGKTYEFLVPQIWSILPSICSDASDAKDNFKNIAQKLGMTINERKELRLPVLAALRKLISKATQSENAADIAELSRFAKNYLPIFFNLYTTRSNGTDEEGQRLAAFDTIKVYLTITSKNLANEMFDRALNKLNEPGADDFFKESIYDLIRVLIGYTDVDKLEKYYGMCIPFLKDNTKQKEQKKAYRFLEEICSSDKEVCKSFLQEHRREIQKELMSSATYVIKTSKGPRLRCLIHLVKLHPQLEKTKFLRAIVPEAVLCVKDANERCRNSAYQLLNVIIEKFLGKPEELQEYTNMLMVGLNGEDKYRCATLLVLASLIYHYSGSLGMETVQEIMDLVCLLIQTSTTREVVESALSYVKVYFSVIPSPIVAPTLPRIVDALSQMKDDCKRHFRQKVRDIFTKLIRKFGIGPISDMVPATDVILHKRLKNINKFEDAKRKNREMKRMKQLENDNDTEFNAKRRPKSIEEILADSDEEFEATENEKPKKNKKRTSRKEAWIQENKDNIVDLIDPAAARNITTTQPGLPNPKVLVKKVKDHDFKTAPDGRLIITDGNEKDSDTEDKKKKKTPFSQSDSEDDYEDKDDVSVITAGIKRKFSDANSDVVSLKSQSTSRYQAGGSGIHRPLKARKIERVPGSEYRGIKARGDIKKKGKLDPYAYVPLTRASLNRRKKKKNAGKFQSIVSGAKKGARIGMKNKRKKH
ncbi:RRP12-like protein [Odontomachus brunneus]|uniref:RRP12-like protein n=1 Tax=Odontomachus brunneus TaxID=486640 RepID=UPI0013F2A61E|nr:RRP12-like protein [Odontomachus brunneus]